MLISMPRFAPAAVVASETPCRDDSARSLTSDRPFLDY